MGKTHMIHPPNLAVKCLKFDENIWKSFSVLVEGVEVDERWKGRVLSMCFADPNARIIPPFRYCPILVSPPFLIESVCHVS